MGQVVRGWQLHRCVDLTFADLARMINPVIRGGMRYYGAFYPTALSSFLKRINTYLLRWIRRKYKRFRSIREGLRAWDRAVVH
ncbi:group II intron maturase-specific domain-containing protein [Mycobacterium sp.]|uniref:group II intron maturase-specific domain-containing protein n=1 Tax=Mycobacterium sp. TaxID=1785 RepID=UPI002D097D42|nr:group II intron maturase-specific domain-containing protein [Mycobacterium sp.]HTH86112.1 group II intron maturase-specific domain-containing protein [Mycobacterium sp.]